MTDTTSAQAFEALACAITCALRAAGTSDDAERARLIRQGFANLGTARDAAYLDHSEPVNDALDVWKGG